MNVQDTAIQILKEAGKPLHIKSNINGLIIIDFRGLYYEWRDKEN